MDSTAVQLDVSSFSLHLDFSDAVENDARTIYALAEIDFT